MLRDYKRWATFQAAWLNGKFYVNTVGPYIEDLTEIIDTSSEVNKEESGIVADLLSTYAAWVLVYMLQKQAQCMIFINLF